MGYVDRALHTATTDTSCRANMTSRAPGSRPSFAVLLLLPVAVIVAGALLALRLYFQPPTVPPYTLAVPSNEAALERGGRFEVDVRPTVPVTGAVGARAFLLRGAEVRPWDPPFEVARDGSVRIVGAVGALFAGVPPGEWEIAVAVGRPETLPTAPKDVLRGRDIDTGKAAWRLVRERIRLGSRGELSTGQ
jgi:hypothetical protein